MVPLLPSVPRDVDEHPTESTMICLGYHLRRLRPPVCDVVELRKQVRLSDHLGKEPSQDGGPNGVCEASGG